MALPSGSPMFKVSEIFRSIQGEGIHACHPAMFLRFSGCNLWPDPSTPSRACPFCDTPQLHKFINMTEDEVVSHLTPPSPDYGLVITGGEPFLQLTNGLLERFRVNFRWVDIETNGTLQPKFDLPRDEGLVISCSPKTKNVRLDPLMVDQWKVLIPDKEEILSTLRWSYNVPVHRIYLQPVDVGGLHSQTYKENLNRALALSSEHGYPLSIQVHKYLSLQ